MRRGAEPGRSKLAQRENGAQTLTISSTRTVADQGPVVDELDSFDIK